MKKKFVFNSLVSVALVSSIFSASIASATSSTSLAKPVENSSSLSLQLNGDNYVFHIENDDQKRLSFDTLKAIAEQAGDQSSITIHNVESAAPTLPRSIHNPENNIISPLAWYDMWVVWTMVKSNISRDNATAAQHIISVAKGQTVTLTQSTTKEISSSITAKAGAPTAEINSNITSKISTTYSKTVTWNGPPESSSYISRMYYWTGFEDRGSYSISGKGNLSGDDYGTYTGTYTEPTYYVEWSRDIK